MSVEIKTMNVGYQAHILAFVRVIFLISISPLGKRKATTCLLTVFNQNNVLLDEVR